MFQHRWQVFNHSIPHLSYELIIWQGSEHSSLNSVYKMLSNLAAQQQPVKSIHELTMNDIQTFMAEQFDPKRFVVRERFKFWSDMKRKPGETIPELASRIRQDAATCDFQSIKDPLDEALRTKFICSVDNEAVLPSEWLKKWKKQPR